MTGRHSAGDDAVQTDSEQKPTSEWADADYVADRNQGFFARLYSGTGAFDVVGRHRKTWYAISGVLMAIAVISIAVRGFTFGIDFEGGTQVSLPAKSGITTSSVEQVFTDTLGKSPQSVQSAGSGNSATIQLRTETLDQQETGKLIHAYAEKFAPEITQQDVNSSDVSSTWGQEITRKMLIALAVFLAVAFVYITIRFDKEMSIAAMASLIFDLVVTAGIYSLVGWEMTPATVIGLLTILGFSVYDTVVVFDKVEENTRSVFATTRRTYAEQTNLAVNQTLMRSINTTVISILPIIALMVVAVWMLGVGTLKDLALIQLVGVIVGTFSSVFFASPILVTLKEMNKDVKRHTAKVLARRDRAKATA